MTLAEHTAQYQSKAKLVQQKHELERYLTTPSAKQEHKSSAMQKLEQIKDALKHDGEIDPAFRVNQKYRQGAIYKNDKE